MSLCAFALRYCTVKAFTGRTLAGDQVYDFPLDAIALALDSPVPVIAVFTDTESNVPDGKALITGIHHQDLEVHVFLPTELKLTIGSTEYDFQGRQSGAALVIDAMMRQMQRILMEDTGIWSVLWRQLVTDIVSYDSRAYVLATGTNSGIRVPARQFMMRCETLWDPPFGQAPTGFWADFLAALTADPDSAGLDALLAGMLIGEALPDWRVQSAEIGASTDDARRLGIGPVDTDLTAPAADTVAPAELIEVDIADRTQPDAPLSTNHDPDIPGI